MANPTPLSAQTMATVAQVEKRLAGEPMDDSHQGCFYSLYTAVRELHALTVEQAERIAALEAALAAEKGTVERWEGTTSDPREFYECVQCGDRNHGEASEAPWHTREHHEPICNKCGR